jgi:hypothetical protein
VRPLPGALGVGVVVGCRSVSVAWSDRDAAGESLEAVHVEHQRPGSPEAGRFGGGSPLFAGVAESGAEDVAEPGVACAG